jgi:hypothetical protein
MINLETWFAMGTGPNNLKDYYLRDSGGWFPAGVFQWRRDVHTDSKDMV